MKTYRGIPVAALLALLALLLSAPVAAAGCSGSLALDRDEPAVVIGSEGQIVDLTAPGPGAVCFPGGGVTMSHGVVGPVEVVDGAIRWNHDNELWMVATLPCVVRYVGPAAEIPSLSIAILCWADGNLVYRSSGSSFAVEAGVATWIEHPSGMRVASTAGCEAMY